MNPALSHRQIDLRIVGMTCAGCVASVEKALRGVPGVAGASVDLLAESASVRAADPAPPVARLVEAVRAAGYDAEPLPGLSEFSGPDDLDPRHRERLRRSRQTMVLAIGVSLPILGLDYAGHLLSATHGAGAFGWRLIQMGLLTLLLAGPAGAPILAAGFQALRHGAGNMDLLIALGVGTAYAGSVFGTLAQRPEFVHAHAAAMILALVAVGRHLELRARRRTFDAVARLARRASRTARVRRDGRWVEIPAAEVAVGDLLSVPPHQAVPVDGVVEAGEAAVDESLLTGEPMPLRRVPGDEIVGGSLVIEGTLTVRATRRGDQSTLARIARLVLEAQRGRTEMQRLADRVSAVFVPLVVAAAAVTVAGHLLAAGGGSAGRALSAAVAVLVVACPCALGLATPAAIVVSSGVAALRGILTRDAAALEALGRADAVVWDKTGTLTLGRPVIFEVHSFDPARWPPERITVLAAAAEQFSQHPIARAMVDRARRDGLPVGNAADFESRPGLGVAATVEGLRVVVGHERLLAERGIAAPIPAVTATAGPGETLAFVAVNNQPIGTLRLADSLRPAARDAVRQLANLGVTSIMLTGDRGSAAAAVGEAAGIREFRADASPQEKAGFIADLRRARRRVAMVGDGINDAPALRAADVGVAFATGADLAVESAGINVVGSSPMRVVDAVVIARATVRVIRQNLGWAFGYNAAMIPLAAVGLLPPSLAAGAMMASSLTVVLNALRVPRLVARRLGTDPARPDVPSQPHLAHLSGDTAAA